MSFLSVLLPDNYLSTFIPRSCCTMASFNSTVPLKVSQKLSCTSHTNKKSESSQVILFATVISVVQQKESLVMLFSVRYVIGGYTPPVRGYPKRNTSYLTN